MTPYKFDDRTPDAVRLILTNLNESRPPSTCSLILRRYRDRHRMARGTRCNRHHWKIHRHATDSLAHQ